MPVNGPAVYLASSYSRRLEMMAHAADLTARGYAVVSTWIDGHHETVPHHDDHAHAPEEEAVWAAEDVADLRRCDWVVSHTEPAGRVGRNRGGRHVEFGLGLAWGKRQIVIGRREHCFHSLPGVLVFPEWAAFLAALDAGAVPG